MLGGLPSCTHPSESFTFPFVALAQNHCASFMLLILRRSRGPLELAQGFIHTRHRCRLLLHLCGVIHIGRGALGSGWQCPRSRHTHTKLSITIVRSLSQTKKAVSNKGLTSRFKDTIKRFQDCRQVPTKHFKVVVRSQHRVLMLPKY